MAKKIAYAFLALILTTVPAVFAQEGEMTDPQMQAWMAYMTPGDAHNHLANQAGKWKLHYTVWMGPGAEPQKTEGSSESKMIMGGRFLETRVEGIMMGMPMQGRNLSGYDNAKKEYFSLWLDNMGTGFAISRGSYNAENKVFSMTGTMSDPMVGDAKFRQTVKWDGANKMIMEMFMDMGGQEFKFLQVDYVRQ